jgi:hypothetical protein
MAKKTASRVHILALIKGVQEIVFSVYDLLKVARQLSSWQRLG